MLTVFLSHRETATKDYDRAMVLFQVLMEELDIQHSRFVQEEDFLQQHNIRRHKHHFQVCLLAPRQVQVHLGSLEEQ